MEAYETEMDLHTHTIASGHGTRDTVTDLSRAAAEQGLALLGISDHGPATPGSAGVSYFRGLFLMPRTRFGVRLLSGVELNVLDVNGRVDLPDDVLERLDYAIISLHPVNFPPRSARENTDALIRAMHHPRVRILGHPDDGRYPLDYERLLGAAKENGVVPELNDASLSPDAWRVSCRENDRALLELCRALTLPILLSSDSHGCAGVGRFGHAARLLRELSFPERLVLHAKEADHLLSASLL